MPEYIRNTIAGVTIGLARGNAELAAGQEDAKEAIDYFTKIGAVIAEIAALTEVVEEDILQLHQKGEEARDHTQAALRHLSQASNGADVGELMDKGALADTGVRDIVETLEDISRFMSTRPRDYFDTFLKGIEHVTNSATIVGQDLKMASEHNSAAIEAINTYGQSL